MVLYRLPIMIFTLSLVYIFIAPEEPYSLKLFLKILPMIAIILYAFRITPKEKRLVHKFLLIGLVISCIGDVLIQWELIGLTVFFLVQLFYSIGLFSMANFTKLRMLTCIPILLYTCLFGTSLIMELQDQHDTALIFPVIAYILLISITLCSAISTGNKPAMLGAFLFVISHSFLVWNLFIGSAEDMKAIIMLSYYAAQFFIAVSLHSIVERKRRIIW